MKIKIDIDIVENKLSYEQRDELEIFLEKIEKRILKFGDKIKVGMVGKPFYEPFIVK